MGLAPALNAFGLLMQTGRQESEIRRAFQDVLNREPSPSELRRYATENGMVTLREDGWAKARAGLTTVPEVLRVTQEES